MALTGRLRTCGIVRLSTEAGEDHSIRPLTNGESPGERFSREILRWLRTPATIFDNRPAAL